MTGPPGLFLLRLREGPGTCWREVRGRRSLHLSRMAFNPPRLCLCAQQGDSCAGKAFCSSSLQMEPVGVVCKSGFSQISQPCRGMQAVPACPLPAACPGLSQLPPCTDRQSGVSHPEQKRRPMGPATHTHRSFFSHEAPENPPKATWKKPP